MKARPWTWLAMGIAALALLAAIRQEAPAPLVGERALALELLHESGSVWSLEDYRGRVLVLNLWATWCPPCRAEMPALQRLSEALPDDGFAVVGISVDEDVYLVEEFLRRLGVRFEVVVDPRGERVNAVLGPRAFPETFLIRADGVIADRILGEQEWDGEYWQARIRALHDA